MTTVLKPTLRKNPTFVELGHAHEQMHASARELLQPSAPASTTGTDPSFSPSAGGLRWLRQVCRTTRYQAIGRPRRRGLAWIAASSIRGPWIVGSGFVRCKPGPANAFKRTGRPKLWASLRLGKRERGGLAS